MSATCPQGHPSVATDYCDTCGAPIAGASAGPTSAGRSAPNGPAAPAAPAVPDAGVACPNCGSGSIAGALFCEACGYDYTTGAMPRGSATPAPTAPDAVAASGSAAPTAPDAVAASGSALGPIAPAVRLESVAEVWVDPDWYAAQDTVDQPCPSPGLPTAVPLTVRSLLIGRVSRSRNIHPEIDCGTDSGVSRRQAQLTTDGTRWFVEDLESSNGTYVGAANDPIPTVALVPGQRRELAPDDRVYVGAWTRIVVRRATEQERSGGA